MNLTPTLKKTLDFIHGYINQHGLSPSVREVAVGIGIRSKSSAHRHIQKLTQMGLLESLSGPRGIHLPENQQAIPIYGTIAAGQATEVFDVTDTWEPLSWFTSDKNTFALRVIGHSMKNAGICDGDMVVCKKSHTVTPQQVAVVLIDNQEVTLKYCVTLSDTEIELQPDNPDYQAKTYQSDRVSIQGFVAVQLRQYG